MPDFKGYHYHHGGPAYAIRAIMSVIIMIIFALIFGYVVQLLWNWLMPGLFSLKQIGYWEGFGIVILARILFGSFLPHPSPHENWRARSYFRQMARDEDFMKGNDRWKKWKFYGDYWKEEGREAFKKYVERHEGETTGNEYKENETNEGDK